MHLLLLRIESYKSGICFTRCIDQKLISAEHPGAVVSLAAVPGRLGMLASLGRDGTVRFWDVVSQQRLATVPAEATAMVRPTARLAPWRHQ